MPPLALECITTFKSKPSAFKSWRDASYSSYDGRQIIILLLSRLCFVFVSYSSYDERQIIILLLSRLCFWVAPRISNLALKRKKLILEKITSLVAGCIQQWHFWGGNQLFTVQSIANNPHIPMAIGEGGEAFVKVLQFRWKLQPIHTFRLWALSVRELDLISKY